MQDRTKFDAVTGGSVARDLFASLYPELHRVACVVAPADVDPNDLVQDALVRFLARRGRTEIEEPVAYLTTTLVHLASNRRRSFLRGRRAFAKLGPEPVSSTPSYPSDLSVLDAVTSRERAVLYLHDVEGRPFEDVADLVGVTAVSARKIAERARRRLQPLVKDEDHAAR